MGMSVESICLWWHSFVIQKCRSPVKVSSWHKHPANVEGSSSEILMKCTVKSESQGYTGEVS